MKCPACDNDVPSGQSACTRCGAPFPSAGEHPGPEGHFAPGPPGNPQSGSSNPATEPLPVPLWNMGGQRPRDVPPERFATPGTDAIPPAPGPAAQNLGGPGADPAPTGHDNATQILGAAGAGPLSPLANDPAGWDQGVPPISGQPELIPPDGRTEKSPKVPLLVGGFAAVAVLGGALVYVLTQGLGSSGDKSQTSGAKPGAGNVAQQAAAVNQILKSGRAARGHLPSRLKTCDDVSAGVSGFQQVVRDRQQELSQSKGLTVDLLQDGSRLRQSMVAAYQNSLHADQAYLAWAQGIRARGCGRRIAPLTVHYKDAVAANDKAGPAKRQVVALWKPIATSHGLPTYAWNRL